MWRNSPSVIESKKRDPHANVSFSASQPFRKESTNSHKDECQVVGMQECNGLIDFWQGMIAISLGMIVASVVRGESSFIVFSIRRAYDSAAFVVGRYMSQQAPQGSAVVVLRRRSIYQAAGSTEECCRRPSSFSV